MEKHHTDPVAVRLVSDFRGVNRILKRPGYPMEGSHQIMKSLNPEEPYFATFDLSSGYHQCRLDPRDRDLFSVILPQGKYRFKVLPQGIKPASDLFNILTDPGLRNQEGFYKNMDDILAAGSSIKQLERRLRCLLEVCR